jgi:sulfite exporter TauE/SafE
MEAGMVCYYHFDQPAIGVCKHCHRGLCHECATLIEDSFACKDHHEDQVGDLNLMAERGILNARRMGAGYTRNAIYYFLVGALVTGFGLLQYRFLELQVVFFILIGLFLIYATAANFIEGTKYN